MHTCGNLLLDQQRYATTPRPPLALAGPEERGVETEHKRAALFVHSLPQPAGARQMLLLLSGRKAALSASYACIRVAGEAPALIRAGKGYRTRGETRKWFVRLALSEEEAQKVLALIPPEDVLSAHLSIGASDG